MYTQQRIPVPLLLASVLIVLTFSAPVQSAFSAGELPFSDDRLASFDTQWIEADTGVSPSARGTHAITFSELSSGLVLFGGKNLSGHLDDTWLYGEDGWSLLAPASKPAERATAGIAYDSLRDRVVLYGGSNSRSGIFELSDTWEFDGNNWIEVTPSTSPGRRSGHKMVFMDSIGRIVMFGGWGPAGPLLDDTWEYDGDNWKKIQTSHSPEPRHYFSMAYDSKRDRVVVFGGCTQWIGSQYYCGGQNDTWEFDGTNWEMIITPVSPPGRSSADMVYDPEDQRIVLFGGCSARENQVCTGNVTNDTWAYDGSNWTQISTTNQPSGRYYHALGYDRNRGVIVLFGGVTTIGDLGDSWELLDSPVGFLQLPYTHELSPELYQLRLQDTWDDRTNGIVDSWVDHEFPNYKEDRGIRTYDGRLRNTGEYNTDLSIDCFESRCYDGHSGLDLLGIPDQIRPAAAGKIVAAKVGCVKDLTGCGAGYGNYVVVDHENGYFTLYAHLESVSKQSGGVTTDEQIGTMGETGRAYGKHLHFGVYADNGNGVWDCSESKWDFGSSLCEDKPVDPFGWDGDLLSPPVQDPWTNLKDGPVSKELWLFPPKSTKDISGPDGGEMSYGGDTIRATFPPGSFAGIATLEIKPAREAEPAGFWHIIRSFAFAIRSWISGGAIAAVSSSTLAVASPNADEFSFSKPITLTARFSDTDVLHLEQSELTFYWWDIDLETWTPLSTTVDMVGQTVTAHTQHHGNFSLQAPIKCPADGSEPDDNYYSVRYPPLEIDYPVQRILDVPEDEDWFHFKATDSLTYHMLARSTEGSVDPILELYDTDGVTLLATGEKGGGESGFTWAVPRVGVYFVRVRGQMPGSFSCASGYTVSIAQVQAPSNVALLGPTIGYVASSYTYTATVSPPSATAPFTYSWQMSAQAPLIQSNGFSNTISISWDTPGRHELTVTAANAAGSISATHTTTVVVPAAAVFSASPVSGTVPLIVSFNNLSTGDYTGLEWDFGDGHTSSESNPIHTYTRPGIFSVALTLADPLGSHTATKNAYIAVAAAPGQEERSIFLPLVQR